MRTKRQTFWERIWASTIVLYTFAATFVVWKALHKYGVNPYLFFVIDLITSWFYGLASARLVVAVIKKRWSETQKWGWLSALNFMLPQVYILVSASHVPKDVYIIIFSVIGVMAAFALIGIASQIRAARKEKSAE
ncbi:MAG: hypothetical protein WCP71_00735 [Actinomycetes bacterium]